MDKRLFGDDSKMFGLCIYAPLFSNFEPCPVNLIGQLDTETTLFRMQFCIRVYKLFENYVITFL